MTDMPTSEPPTESKELIVAQLPRGYEIYTEAAWVQRLLLSGCPASWSNY